MADVSNLIAQAASASPAQTSVPVPQQKQAEVAAVAGTKQEQVAAAGDEKKIEIGGLPSDETFRNAVIARSTGSGANSGNPIENDLRTLSPEQLSQKYGAGPASAMTDKMIQAQDLYNLQTTGQRDWWNRGKDTATGLASGAVSMGSLAALPLSAADMGLNSIGVPTHMGLSTNQTVKGWQDTIDTNKSPALQNQIGANAERSNLDARDNDATENQQEQGIAQQYIADKANGDSDFIAGAKIRARTLGAMGQNFGTTAVDAIRNAAQNPALAADTVAGFAGSLIGSGPLTKVFKAAGEAIVPTATRKAIALASEMDKGTGTLSTARTLDAIGKQLPSSTLTSLGAVEAGSTNENTSTEIASTPFEELAKTSPMFQKLVAGGVSQEQARNEVANRGGMVAAALAGAASMGVAKLTDIGEFREHPFSLQSFGHAAADIAKETAHEGLLGMSDTTSENIGKQQSSNENQSLGEGVAQQMGLAALGGFGSAGATQSPSLVKGSLSVAGKAAIGATIKPVVAAANSIAAKKQAVADAKTDGEVATVGAQEQTKANDPDTQATLNTAITQAKAQDSQRVGEVEPIAPRVQALSDAINSRRNFDPKEVSESTLPDPVKDQVARATNRVDLLQKLASIVMTKGIADPNGLAAASFLKNQLDQHYSMVDADPQAFNALSDDSPAGKLNLEYNKISDSVASSPAISKAVDTLSKITPEQAEKAIQPVTKESLSTPEGQQNAINAATLASVAPDRGNLEANKAILAQIDDNAPDQGNLTPNQISALRASVALMQAAKDASENQKEQGHNTPINTVHQQIMTDPDGNKVSAAQYVANIYKFMQNNDRKQATQSLHAFGQFVQHMQNKLNAINAHYAKGGGEKVANTALNNDTRQWYKTEGQARQSVDPTNAKSVEYAQKVSIEANMLSQIYNGLNKAYPTLKGGVHTSSTLAKNLQGNIKDVVKAHASKSKAVATRPNPSLVSAQSKTLITSRTIKAAKEAQAQKPEATPGANSTTARSGNSDVGAEVSPKERADLITKIREQNKLDAAGYRSLNERLAKLSVLEFISLVSEARGNDWKFEPLPENKIQSAVQSILSTLGKTMGLKSAAPFVRMILSKSDPTGAKTKNTFFRTGPFIGISESMIKGFLAGEIPLARIQQMMAHELGHAIDFHGATSGPMASLGHEENGRFDTPFSGDGVLWHEFEALESKLPDGVSSPNYTYIMGQPTERQAIQEFFAELGAFVLQNPALAKELIPNGTKAFETILRQAAETLGLNEPRLVDGSNRIAPVGGDLGERGQGSKSEDGERDIPPPTDDGYSSRSDPNEHDGTKPTKADRTKLERLQKRANKDEASQAELDEIQELEAKFAAQDKADIEARTEAFKSSEPTTVKEAYPGLIGSQEGENVKNWFLKAFRLPKTVQSRLVGLVDPLRGLKAALENPAAFEQFTGKKLDANIPAHVFKNYQLFLGLIEPFKDEMNEMLAKKLAHTNKTGAMAGKSLLDNMLEGKKVNSMREMRLFNLAEKQEDDSYKYNDALLTQAIAAALQWSLISDNFRSRMDVDQVESLTSIPADSAANIVPMLNFGLSPLEAVRSLSSKITQFWGVKANSNVPLGHTQGIPLAMAAELLVVMRNAEIFPGNEEGQRGLIRATHFEFTEKDGVPIPKGKTSAKREVYRLSVNIPKVDVNTGKTRPLFVAPSLIEQAVLAQPEDKNFYGDDKVPVAPTQMNNPDVENTKEGKQAIRVANKIDYLLNEPMHALGEALGLDKLQEFFGGGEKLNKRILNKVDRASREGQNTMVRSAFEAVTNRISEMSTLPQATLSGLGSVIIHYAHNMSSVNRLQQLGGQTPQGNKWVREIFMPTWSTVDLHNPDDMHFFRLALAQALDVKIGRRKLSDINSELDQKLAGLSQTIGMLQEHQKTGKIDPEKFDIAFQTEMLTSEVALTPVALNVLNEYARYLNSSEEERSSFRTPLYVEADGVTNGVVNALNMFSASYFTPEQLENMRRGGRFMDGGVTKTMNDYRSQSGSTDLYAAGADNTKAFIDKLVRDNGKDSAIAQQLTHVLNLLNQFGNGIKFNEDTGELTIDRGATKNPMTITLYGSGPGGIAGNIAGGMAELLYKRLSEVAEQMHDDPSLSIAQAMWRDTHEDVDTQHKEFLKLLNGLVQTSIDKNFGDLVVYQNELKAITPANFNLLTFEFTLHQLNAIQSNVLYTLVKPMVQAIEKTLGKSMMNSIKLVQRATQIQSISAEHIFRELVKQEQEYRAKNDPDYAREDGLSQDDLDAIKAKVMKTHPLVQTKGQNFFPAHSSKSDMTGASSASSTGEFESTAQVHGPADAGVKGLSMINQGMGDGNMIQHMLINGARGLPVFDGFNFALDQVKDGSVKANQAAYESQQGNPQRAVFNAFKVFADNITADQIDSMPDLKNALSNAIFPFDPPADAFPIMSRIKDTLFKLEKEAIMVDARHQVLDGIESYNDNMAGAAAPYVHPGEKLTATKEENAKALNVRINKIIYSKERQALEDDNASEDEDEEQPTVAELDRKGILLRFSEDNAPDDDRIDALNERFDQVFSRFENPGDPGVKVERGLALQKVSVMAAKLGDLAKAQGFAMSFKAQKAFGGIVQALALDMKLDPAMLAQADRIYRNVIKQLHPGLLEDPSDPDTISREGIAHMKFDFLVGNAGREYDDKKRSSLLPVFLGLAVVDPILRKALSDLELPKSHMSPGKTGMEMLENVTNRTMDSLAAIMSGQGKATNVQTAIDLMTHHMAKSALDTTTVMDSLVGAPNSITNAANDAFVGFLNRGSKWAVNKSRDVQANTKNSVVEKIAQITEIMSHMITAEGGAHLAEATMTGLNKTMKGPAWQPIHDMIADIIGRTKSNMGPYDLIKVARAMVQQARQQFIEHVPKMFADAFSKPLEKAQWTSLYKFAKADVASLTDAHTHDQVLDMMAKPKFRDPVIQMLKDELKTLDPKHFDKVIEKANQLAEHMANGKRGTNLLKNAKAVADLLNERKYVGRVKPSTDYVKKVDRLVTLMAMNKLSPEVQAHITELVKNEREGVNFALSYLNNLRKDENAKTGGMTKYNALKGYIPSHQKAGVSLKVASDKDRHSLENQSWIRIADYKGSKSEGIYDSKGYYFLPASNRSAFAQGMMQNAQASAGGADAQSGESEMHAGLITNPVTVLRITKRLALEKNQTSENLQPIFNEHGRVVAYERSLDEGQLAGLDRSTHLALMAGAWRGRQVEEGVAQKFNEQLVNKLKDMFDADLAKSASNVDAYVDLFDPKAYKNDPIIKDAMSLMTPETRKYIKKVFGDEFMVRRDMIKDAIGYRTASIGDAWTGTTRWNDEVQEGVKNILTSILGKRAFELATNAEGMWQEVVNEVKSTIMIKSLVMPAINIASDIVQLMGRGVSMGTIVKSTPKKVTEVAAYVRGRLRRMDAEAALYVARGSKDAAKILRLNSEIQAIDDMNKRLSIWPLIQAGEFGLIADLGTTRSDLEITHGRLAQHIERLTNMLPEAVRNAGNIALIGSDTPLYEGIQKSMEYGDFIMKSLYYDHLLNRGLDSKTALGHVSEEFVNFDRNQGRFRASMEKNGLMWFFNYKLRSAKIALSMLRDNPVQSLMMMHNPLIPHSIGLGKFVGDNIFGKVAEGNWTHAIGPGMMFRAAQMQPLYQLLH